MFCLLPLKGLSSACPLDNNPFPTEDDADGNTLQNRGRRRDKDSSSQDEPRLFKILLFSKQIHRGLDSQLLLENASPPSWHFPRVMSGGRRKTHADVAAVRAGTALTQTGPVEHACLCEVESWAILQDSQATGQSGQWHQRALIHWLPVGVA